MPQYRERVSRTIEYVQRSVMPDLSGMYPALVRRLRTDINAIFEDPVLQFKLELTSIKDTALAITSLHPSSHVDAHEQDDGKKAEPQSGKEKMKKRPQQGDEQKIIFIENILAIIEPLLEQITIVL